MIYPRSLIGTPQPPATRRKLDRVSVVLAHDTGVENTSRYRSADPLKVLDDARSVARFGIASNRPWEYNYLIGLDGSIFEQAGEFMGAHCLNFNDRSAGVLFINTPATPPNAAQVAAWFEVREHMVARGTLAANHEAAPHYRYRSTSCPGIRAQPPGGPWESPTGQGRMGNLIDVLTAPLVTPPPITGDPLMFIAKPGPELAQFGDIAWFAVHESGIVRHASGPDTDGAPTRLIRGTAHWNIYARASNAMSGSALTLLPE